VELLTVAVFNSVLKFTTIAVLLGALSISFNGETDVTMGSTAFAILVIVKIIRKE
jgi:hypothetical protein